MSVKRRDLVKYLEENGYSLLREGKKHSIYTKGERTIPSRGTACSTELQPISYASKPASNRSSKTRRDTR